MKVRAAHCASLDTYQNFSLRWLGQDALFFNEWPARNRQHHGAHQYLSDAQRFRTGRLFRASFDRASFSSAAA
jgi:hypothetical protein